MKAVVAVCVLVALAGLMALTAAPLPSPSNPRRETVLLPPPAARPQKPEKAAVPPAPDGRARAAARRVLLAYATEWLNWSGRTLPRQQGRLAALSTGRLAVVHRVGSRDPATARALARRGEGARGRVLTLRLAGTASVLRAGVIVRERFLGRDLRRVGAPHLAIYLARLTRGPAGWRVIAWAPELETGSAHGEP